jgi:radical SAM superfamily enzyme YgiQ (UPF0313 family)
MKVLFSNPPWWVEPVSVMVDGRPSIHWMAGIRAGSRWPHTIMTHCSPDDYHFGSYLPYPFFLGYATTYAAKMTGAKCVMRDSLALRESYETYLKHLIEEQYQYIFIESASPSWEHDSQLIDALSKIVPDSKIVLTGPISSMGAELIEKHPVHAVIKGEYEKGSVKVINGASGVLEHDLLTLAEMNDSPFPYYDDVIAHRYWDANPLGQFPPHAHVWSSRGCPFKCIFCVWPATMTGNDPDGTSKRTVRHYTPEYMEAFLSELVGRYDYRTIYFDDDTFNIGNAHVLKMSEVMRKINRPWSAMCRADTSRLESWQVMRDAGCFGVKVGFESGNQWVVDNIVNKHLDLDFARKAVEEIKRVGMTCHGTFTYGLPGETAEQMADTKRFIASLPLDTWQESGTAAIEGTPLANLADEAVQKVFPGARADSNYVVEHDGAKKWRELAATLRAH